MDEKTRRALELFEEISRIPRCSGNEEAVARWFQSWAAGNGWPAVRDRAGNLRIDVPATAGCERAPGVVIQGHLDMVCEKTPESAHDFSQDSIRVIRDGDWVHAAGTTLGADNGVALALGAAVAEDRGLRRPALELLFTVDEETGLSGAKQLSPGFLTGRTLINLDSETEGVFTVGCAGGRDLTLERDLGTTPYPEGWRALSLAVGGLRGGHSGVDIHRRRANATKLLARALNALLGAEGPWLVTLTGGSRHNAIPRDAAALIACAPGQAAGVRRQAAALRERLRAEFETETELSIVIADADPPPAGMSALPLEDARLLVNLLLAVPHGPLEMAPDFPDLVLSSNNLAVTTAADGRLSVLTSQRSLTAAGLEAATEAVRAVAGLAGGRATVSTEYPPWTPNPESALLARSRQVYRSLFGRDPAVRAIHAGLECALIGGFFPGMDMISFGPTTEDAHCPSERLNLPSLARLRGFLTALLESLSAGG
jgi:dipeptidase D